MSFILLLTNATPQIHSRPLFASLFLVFYQEINQITATRFSVKDEEVTQHHQSY